jgi:hypothetical protein
MALTIGSMFTGYGGLDLAIAGELEWYAEIDKAANHLLNIHHPSVPNLGDVSLIDWEDVLIMPAPRNDALAEAMYADYCGGMGLVDVAAKWKRTRQSIWKMFDRRGYAMRPVYTGRRDLIEYEGQNYTPANVGYYRSTSGDRNYLHRRVYEDNYGAIPYDWDVHHVDHDKANNDPSNLIALSKDDHTRLHAAEEVVPGSPSVDVLTAGYP